MKDLHKLCIILFAVVFISGCTKQKDKLDYTPRENAPVDNINNKKDDGSLKFINKELVKSYKDCKPGDENCTYIRLKYIEATEGKIKDKVNGFIQKILLFTYEMPDMQSKNPEEMMTMFLRDYETFRKEVPSAPQVWTAETNISVFAETDKILCISNEISSYLGGAHPNSGVGYFNFNKETGDTITLANLFKPGFEQKLNTLIDKKYRAMKNLKPEDSLTEKGDLFENKITFNYNFSVNKDKGLEFTYNAYNIAPYAVGPITVTLPRSDLEDILSLNSLLK